MADTGPPAPRPLRSRVVLALKFLLPSLAAALIGAVVFWDSAPRDRGARLTFSDADLAAMRSGLRITRPQVSATSMTGDSYDFTARLVEPADLEMTRADVTALEGRVDFAGGRRLHLAAAQARLDFPAETVVLEAGVRLSTDDGWRARAPRVTIDIARSVLTAPGPVSGSGPPGEIEAGGLVIRPADPGAPEGIENGAIVRFTNGVRVRWRPATPEETP